MYQIRRWVYFSCLYDSINHCIWRLVHVHMGITLFSQAESDEIPRCAEKKLNECNVWTRSGLSVCVCGGSRVSRKFYDVRLLLWSIHVSHKPFNVHVQLMISTNRFDFYSILHFIRYLIAWRADQTTMHMSTTWILLNSSCSLKVLSIDRFPVFRLVSVFLLQNADHFLWQPMEDARARLVKWNVFFPLR